MTSWTDLIDTDPVAAAKLWLEGPIEDTSDRILPTENMVSNLAALCEALSHFAYDCNPYQDDEMAAAIRRDFMNQRVLRSRRFPEVK